MKRIGICVTVAVLLALAPLTASAHILAMINYESRRAGPTIVDHAPEKPGVGGVQETFTFKDEPTGPYQLPDNGFKVRTNPKSFAGVQAPGMKNLDLNVAKFFNVTERVRVELKLEAYNISNTFTGRDPSTNVTSSNFGVVTRQARGTLGREMQYNIRIHF